MTAYQSITVGEDEESAQNLSGSKQKDKSFQICMISFLTIGLLLLIASPFIAFPQKLHDEEKALISKIQRRHINVPMPAGVNLGSWVR